MKIRMMKTVRGSPDGYSLHTYEAGVEYEIGGTPRADDLAAVFLREKWGEPLVSGDVLVGVPALVVGAEEAAIAKPLDEVVVEVQAQPERPFPARRRGR